MARLVATVALMVSMPQVAQASWPTMTNQSAAEVLRRLNTVATTQGEQKGVMSAACQQACPGLQGIVSEGAYHDAAKALQKKYQGMGQEEMMKHIGEMTAEMMMLSMDLVCTHTDSFKCAADNAAACQDPSGQDQQEFTDSIKHMDCLCDSCPSLKTGYATFTGTMTGVLMSAFAGMGGGSQPTEAEKKAQEEEMKKKVMTAMCGLSSGLECANSNKNTCSGMFDSGSDGGSAGNGGVMTMDMSSMMDKDLLSNVDKLKTQCKAEGYSIAPPKVGGSKNENDLSSATMAIQSVFALGVAIAAQLTA